MIDNRLGNFLKELSDLTKKYNISIGGCGCCGSPYLIDLTIEKNKYICDCLEYEDGKYTVIVECEDK